MEEYFSNRAQEAVRSAQEAAVALQLDLAAPLYV